MYVDREIPVEELRSAAPVFFIVTGSLCSLPIFTLASEVARSLGLRLALLAFFAGGLVAAVAGSFSAFAGSSTRMGLGVLAQRAFGTHGAQLVRLVVALALAGWFTVDVSLLSSAASDAVHTLYGVHFPFVPACMTLGLLVVLVGLRGIHGLEHLGQVIVLLMTVLLCAAIWLSRSRLPSIGNAVPTGEIHFGKAASLVVSMYIVGILIQPDYNRFVRRPPMSAVAIFCALGVAFPLILISSALPILALGTPNLLTAMGALRIGAPALALLVLSAWLDSTACVYSASLAFASEFPRLGYRRAVVLITLLGTGLAALRADHFFISYLSLLSMALPPLVPIVVIEALAPSQALDNAPRGFFSHALAAWCIGGSIAAICYFKEVTVTGVNALDTIVITAALTLLFRKISRHR